MDSDKTNMQRNNSVDGELDRLNRGFVWRHRLGPFRLISPEQAEHFNRWGYIVLRNAIEPSILTNVRSAIDAVEAQYEASLLGGTDGNGTRVGKISFTHHVVLQSTLVRAFAVSDLFVNICSDLLGPNVRLYWDQAIYKKAACEVDVPWHQDTGYVFTEPQDYLTCWVPLADVSKENGCLWVKPGKHLRGTLRHRMTQIGYTCGSKADVGLPLEVEAGDVAVLSALVPHRTGPNLSDSTRKAYLLQYAVDGTRVLRDHLGNDVNKLCQATDRQFWLLEEGRAAAGNR